MRKGKGRKKEVCSFFEQGEPEEPKQTQKRNEGGERKPSESYWEKSRTETNKSCGNVVLKERKETIQVDPDGVDEPVVVVVVVPVVVPTGSGIPILALTCSNVLSIFRLAPRAATPFSSSC